MITINGVQYEQREQSKPKKYSGSNDGSMAMLMGIMSMSMYGPYGGSPARSKPLPTDDIVKEFELIQLKQSKLSRSERDRVVAAFNRKFKPVK